jgi:hypothetical protein
VFTAPKISLIQDSKQDAKNNDIYMVRVVLSINNGYFPKHHNPIGFCNERSLCLLAYRNWIFECHLNEFLLQRSVDLEQPRHLTLGKNGRYIASKEMVVACLCSALMSGSKDCRKLQILNQDILIVVFWITSPWSLVSASTLQKNMLPLPSFLNERWYRSTRPEGVVIKQTTARIFVLWEPETSNMALNFQA